ncbi:MAG: ChaN family lipoprotein [Nitrospira sp.]|nr:ChaN family lipoprotein [Nitrospira sp.]
MYIPFSPIVFEHWRSVATLSLSVFLLVFPSGCAMERGGGPGPNLQIGWQPWEILDTRTGQVISFPDLIKDLEQQDIIYLGEEHHNPHHIEAALKVLTQLVEDGIEPTIGMEMFGWDGQAALDSYVSTTQPVTNEFLEQVRWKQNWGGAFEDYVPLLTFARDRHVSVRAMNPPKPLIRHVVKLGLDQAKQDPEWATWGLDQEEIVDDPAYREKIFDQLQRCHGGSPEHYRTMYEASMVRDEGMAKTLVLREEELRRDQTGTRRIIVSYTGAGHVQYGLPVPKRVARRLDGEVKQATIYLLSFDSSKAGDVRSLIQEPIADYIWLTPMDKARSVKPCR